MVHTEKLHMIHIEDQYAKKSADDHYNTSDDDQADPQYRQTRNFTTGQEYPRDKQRGSDRGDKSAKDPEFRISLHIRIISYVRRFVNIGYLPHNALRRKNGSAEFAHKHSTPQRERGGSEFAYKHNTPRRKRGGSEFAQSIAHRGERMTERGLRISVFIAEFIAAKTPRAERINVKARESG